MDESSPHDAVEAHHPVNPSNRALGGLDCLDADLSPPFLLSASSPLSAILADEAFPAAGSGAVQRSKLF